MKDRKYELIKQLVLKMESLNAEDDKKLIERIENLRRQLEVA